MIRLLWAIIVALSSGFRSRRGLMLENLALRQQLATVLQKAPAADQAGGPHVLGGAAPSVVGMGGCGRHREARSWRACTWWCRDVHSLAPRGEILIRASPHLGGKGVPTVASQCRTNADDDTASRCRRRVDARASAAAFWRATASCGTFLSLHERGRPQGTRVPLQRCKCYSGEEPEGHTSCPSVSSLSKMTLP